ncbi:MAG: chemotaxis protein CheW [Magnetococcales bacterium]|nr:chemotaxis protein CheW [Magnetococcales bacterium]
MVSIQEKRDCLIFEVSGKWYGVSCLLVREIVRLPEILPMEDAPHFVAGVINLRGHVVSVVDLNLRMGRHAPRDYALTDFIVVVEWRGTPVGIIVNDVREVRELLPGDVEPCPAFAEHETHRYRHVTEVAKVGGEMVMLLDPEHLLHGVPREEDTPAEHGEAVPEILTECRRFNPGASDRERALFHARAQRLMRSPEAADEADSLPLAVVRLHGENFGVNLAQVQGFAHLRQVTPIPCCPDHVAGSMNLRGDILTLVDLSRILHLNADPKSRPAKVMVARIDHLTVGVLVHDVVDVIHRRPDLLAKAPVGGSGPRQEHLSGAVPHGDAGHESMLGILNLEALLQSQELLVHETV